MMPTVISMTSIWFYSWPFLPFFSLKLEHLCSSFSLIYPYICQLAKEREATLLFCIQNQSASDVPAAALKAGRARGTPMWGLDLKVASFLATATLAETIITPPWHTICWDDASNGRAGGLSSSNRKCLIEEMRETKMCFLLWYTCLFIWPHNTCVSICINLKYTQCNALWVHYLQLGL